MQKPTGKQIPIDGKRVLDWLLSRLADDEGKYNLEDIFVLINVSKVYGVEDYLDEKSRLNELTDTIYSMSKDLDQNGSQIN